MPLILRKSSIIQINHMLKKPNNRIYVSDLVINENVVHPFHFKKNEIQIIIAIIKMNSHHHIVGVPALCQ
jgi:agmatine/peptidylarginine deiminase